MDSIITKKAKMISNTIITNLHKKTCFKCGQSAPEKVFSTVLLNKHKKPSFKLVEVCHDCFIDTKYTF